MIPSLKGLLARLIAPLMKVLLKPLVLALLLVLALSIAVWMFGPALEMFGGRPLGSIEARLAVISALIGLWLIALLIAWLNGGSPAPEEEPNPEEDARQRHKEMLAARCSSMVTRFERQMAVLREHLPGKRSGQFAYHLPWFLVLGTPGAGKTTLLTRSDQDFPLSHVMGTDPLAPVVPTEDVPCWVTNDAVYIDTPGALLRSDGADEETINRQWDTLISLLNRFRGRRPINGIVLVLSLEALVGQSEYERATEAQAIRHRLLSLIDRLGTRFPIYVLVSKVDMLAGFVEFFDDLRKHERGQIWGMSFELPRGKDGATAGAEWLDAFRKHYTAMTDRLNDRLLKRLSDERDPGRRALIYGFPQRMGGIRGMIEDTLAQIFVVDRYSTPPMLRGVYFTSAVQVGVPHDPLMGAVSLSFDVERPPLPAHRAAHPFFTSRVFGEILVPEAGLAADNRRVEGRKAWLHRMAYASSAVVVAGCGYAWWTSYQTNVGMLSDTMGHLETYVSFSASGAEGLEDTVQALEALRQVRDRFTLDATNPLLARVALSSSHALAPLSEDAYTMALKRDFAPRVAAQVAAVLRGNLDREGPELHDALRVYLMLTQPQYLDRAVVRNHVSALWADRYPQQPALRRSMLAHLDAWMGGEPVTAAAAGDAQLIARARQVLSRVPRAERAYNSLKSEGLARLVGGIDVSRNGGPLFHLVFRQRAGGGEAGSSEVPRLFTAEGWETYFSPRATDLSHSALSDSWVVGDLGQGTLNDREFRAFQYAIGEHYMRDYVAEWRTLLNTLDVVPFESLPQSVQVLEAMSGPASPMRAILDMVTRNTRLPLPEPELDDEEEEEAGEPGAAPKKPKVPKKAAKAVAMANKVAGMIGGPGGAGDGTAAALPPGHLDATTTVETFFAPLNGLMRAEGDTSYYDSINVALSELYTFTRTIAESVDPPAAALEVARARAEGQADDPITKLRLIASSAPAPVDGWLRSVANQTWGVILRTAQEHLNDQWAATVYTPWQQRIAGRYPVDPTSSRDVTLQDLAAFLGPRGTLENFVTANLAPFINTQTWRLKVIDGASIAIDDQVLTQLRHARAFRAALFTADGQIPEMTFSLQPARLDQTVARAILDVDGQTLDYRHGPVRMAQMRWPNPDGTARSELRFQEVGPFGRILRTGAEGPWAWFRLLDGATIQDVDDRLRVTFTLSERQVAYDLWTDRQASPFLLATLPRLDLPPRL